MLERNMQKGPSSKTRLLSDRNKKVDAKKTGGYKAMAGKTLPRAPYKDNGLRKGLARVQIKLLKGKNK